MKRLVALILTSLLCILLLASCGNNNNFTLNVPQSEVKNFETMIVDTITSWLDNNGFEKVLSQDEFMEYLGTITYQGKKLTDVIEDFTYGDLNEFGNLGGDGVISYVHNNYKNIENGITTIYNQLSFNADIENLKLPFEIDLGDDLETTLCSLAQSVPDLNELLRDSSLTEGITLWAKDNVKLTFKTVTDALNKKEFCLIFSEAKEILGEDSEYSQLFREIVFSFDPSTTHLDNVTITAKEIG